MALLADQELTGMAPIYVQSETEEFVDFGYYTDANGYKQFGVIPKSNAQSEIKYGGDKRMTHTELEHQIRDIIRTITNKEYIKPIIIRSIDPEGYEVLKLYDYKPIIKKSCDYR